MTINTLKAGDAVQLTTGGPTMTIDYMSKEGTYMCKWQEETGWQSAEFTPEQIRAIDRKARNK